MALHPVIYLLMIHAAFLYIAFAYPKDGTTDIQALLKFKSQITSDPLQVMKSWNESTPFCKWHGVMCGSRHKRVKVLYLNSSKIVGTISPYVGNLSFLGGLYLQNNSFTGNIPPEIGRLQRLRILRLRNNSLIGRIPSNLSNCYNLFRLDLLGNYLEGEIPAELGSLQKLNFLSLFTNNLSGQIPPSLGNLSNLERLELVENKLSGLLPDTLGRLNKLSWLSVGGNRLSGSIPASIYNLSSLSMFSVANNLIHGNLPVNLFNTLPNLQYFIIWGNQMTGSIPTSLSNASSLVDFKTNWNKFNGEVPSLKNLHMLRRLQISYNYHGNGDNNDLDFLCSLTNNTIIDTLSISFNNFGGTLLKYIGNLSSLVYVDMVYNSINGLIPVEIGNLINLQALSIGNNQFSGEIPSSIGNLEMLVILYLDGNKLSGDIPSSLGNLKQLIELSIGHNKLQGTIPHALSGCKSLNKLYLDANDLVGAIPLEIFQISTLLEINMTRNRLHGPLPELVENLENLYALDVSENMLSQAIPSGLGNCFSLLALFMQGNFFNGMIPPSLGSLRSIGVLDLSRNNLSSQIPKSLAGLIFIENLNLSYNNLEGPVPEDGIFKNASKVSVIGNKKLCGGVPELSLPRCNIEVSNRKASHTIVKVVCGILGGILGILSLIRLWIFFWFRRKRNIGSESTSNEPLLRLSYQSLLKATNGFSSTNILGSGSFGSVYKAILDTSTTTVAVKVFDLQRYGASKSFLAECEVLRKIRHRNLVKILTACSTIDFSGNDFKALIYEFMANGNLEDWLHPVESISQTQKHLGLIQRLNIAIDVACAIDYLHNHCEISIVHRDIKPSNVLLDDEMIAHVGDFGLSKILLDASNDTTCGQTISTGFNGTIGYIAPEYGMGTSVSTQGDVYSYGILLLEMFTGKRPNDDIFHESTNINCFVKAALPNKIAEIVDPTLLVEIQEFSNARIPILEHLITIFEIGVSCSTSSPMERKGMKDVVAELKFVRRKIIGNQAQQNK